MSIINSRKTKTARRSRGRLNFYPFIRSLSVELHQKPARAVNSAGHWHRDEVNQMFAFHS
jgi:uncharacterized membrane protein